VVLDPQSGGILAYVGSVDYFKEGWGSFDVATAYRQPGSSIKPVTYALALAGSYTLASVIDDSAVSYPQADGKSYTPVNYDGKFHGKVTFRQALANSYNIPAVKIADSVRPDNIVSLGREMGLTNWQIGSGYGLSVTLGGKEVRLLDLSNVYATLARRGIYKPAKPFISVKDGRGFEINSGEVKENRTLSEEVSYLIWSVLSDNYARIQAFGPNSYLAVPRYTVAVKTGTTDAKKDNWTFGFTPSYVVGVWVGNNDGSPMNAYLASGLSGAAPIWNKVFRIVLEGKTNEVPQMPNGITVKYDQECGRSEMFIKGSTVPQSLCRPDSTSVNTGKNSRNKKPSN
jgi:membrane carboxypeptidase/penicillin-binding protein PbpC